MAASASPPISRTRELLTGAWMLGAAGIMVKEALPFNYSTPFLILLAAVLTASGAGLTRRSLPVQILSRGAAWIVLLPALLVTGFALADGQAPPLEVAGLAITTGAALLFARPMLHTREARAEFSPKVFRRWLLAGSTATAATGFVAGAIAITSFSAHGVMNAPALGFAALAASLFASSVAVVRMRSWGIFLGALTSLVLLVTGVFVGRAEALLLALASAPTLLMHLLPVLVARWSRSADSSKVRVTSELADEPHSATRYRVADADADARDDLGVETEPRMTERAALRA